MSVSKKVKKKPIHPTTTRAYPAQGFGRQQSERDQLTKVHQGHMMWMRSGK